MAKYSLTCNQSHEDAPETFTVEADSDDEAVGKMLEVSKAHGAEKHSEAASMSEEEAKNWVTSN